VEGLVAAGMTVRAIGDELSLSTGTVRMWLRRYGLSTAASQRSEAIRASRDDGLPAILMICSAHGETEFVLEGRGHYRCLGCRQERVARHRRKLKEILVAESGGGCAICGYSRYLGALRFHHLNPQEKRIEISRNGVTLSLAALQAEAANAFSCARTAMPSLKEG
jgi:hypothetical protein